MKPDSTGRWFVTQRETNWTRGDFKSALNKQAQEFAELKKASPEKRTNKPILSKTLDEKYGKRLVKVLEDLPIHHVHRDAIAPNTRTFIPS